MKVVLLPGHSLLQFPGEMLLMSSLCGFKHGWKAHVEITWQNLCRFLLERGGQTLLPMFGQIRKTVSLLKWIHLDQKELLVKDRTEIFQVKVREWTLLGELCEIVIITSTKQSPHHPWCGFGAAASDSSEMQSWMYSFIQNIPEQLSVLSKLLAAQSAGSAGL